MLRLRGRNGENHSQRYTSEGEDLEVESIRVEVNQPEQLLRKSSKKAQALKKVQQKRSSVDAKSIRSRKDSDPAKVSFYTYLCIL